MVKYKVTADTSYKKEQRFKEILSFVIYSLAAPMANFRPLLRGQCHSPNDNHTVYSSFNPKVTGDLITTLVP